MLRFNRKIEYALIALVNMDDIQTQSEPVTSKSISSQFNIPSEIMGKVLQALARYGLLTSVQGVKGGYTLAKPLDQISIYEIIEAIDGSIALASCVYGSKHSCDQFGICGLQTPIEIVQNELVYFFKNISLQDLKVKYSTNSVAAG